MLFRSHPGTDKAAAIAAACFFVSSLSVPGCEKPGTSATSTGAASTGQTDPAPITHTYKTRGIIMSLPVPGSPASELQIQHEAIDGFVGASGEVVGMNAMTMPFPRLATGVTLDGLVKGDKVEFTFTNTWSGPAGSRRPDWVVDSMAKLPADTELVFGQKQTPAPGGP